MGRTLIALLVAPLVVPILLFAYLRGLLTTNFWLAFGLLISVVVAYIGMVVLGVPAYLFLRARGWTSFWVAPVLGFAVGAVMWLVFSAAFALALDQGIAGVRSSLSDPGTLSGVLWPGGIVGAAVGVAFWLIARPGR
jgi:hypothetical protein